METHPKSDLREIYPDTDGQFMRLGYTKCTDDYKLMQGNWTHLELVNFENAMEDKAWIQVGGLQLGADL